MNVLKEIKKEHDEFKSIISKIENSKGEKNKTLFRKLYAKLRAIMKLKKELFFQMLKINQMKKKNMSPSNLLWENMRKCRKRHYKIKI